MHSTNDASAQILAALTQQNELLTQILTTLNRPKLGLHTEPIGSLYIYCNRSNNCLWYTVKDGAVEPLAATAITGYVADLKFEKVQRRGKDTWKTQLTLATDDRRFTLESGYDSRMRAQGLKNSMDFKGHW
jgi:hypothetical protein